MKQQYVLNMLYSTNQPETRPTDHVNCQMDLALVYRVQNSNVQCSTTLLQCSAASVQSSEGQNRPVSCCGLPRRWRGGNCHRNNVKVPSKRARMMNSRLQGFNNMMQSTATILNPWPYRICQSVHLEWGTNHSASITIKRTGVSCKISLTLVASSRMFFMTLVGTVRVYPHVLPPSAPACLLPRCGGW